MKHISLIDGLIWNGLSVSYKEMLLCNKGDKQKKMGSQWFIVVNQYQI